MRTLHVLLHLFLALGFSSPLTRRDAVPAWRQWLDEAWTNASSPRALLVSHGGAWNLADPYSSLGAFERAAALGADGSKGDYRVSRDGHGMVVHSSPFAWYESLNCRGKRCEEMTAEEVTRCDMYLTSWKVCGSFLFFLFVLTNVKFMNVTQLLAYTEGKMVTMLDVKHSPDMPHAIHTLECSFVLLF
jgi:glycerophosphoryl diester phosphodiesterase